MPITGNIPRRLSGLSCRLSQPEAGSLTRFTASIIKPLMLHRKGDRTRRLFILRGIGVTPLYATVTRLEPSFNTTARPLAPWCCHFLKLASSALFPESNRSGALSLPAEPAERECESFEPMSPRVERRPLGNRTPPTLWIAATQLPIVGFEPTFCDKPQFLPLELFER